MAFEYDGRDWDGRGIKITRNAHTFTIETTIETNLDDAFFDDAYDEREIPLVEFCKALGLQPIPEEVRDGLELD